MLILYENDVQELLKLWGEYRKVKCLRIITYVLDLIWAFIIHVCSQITGPYVVSVT